MLGAAFSSDCVPVFQAPSRNSCTPATVVCDSTNETQVTGLVGITTAAGKALVGPDGVIRVRRCLEHLLDLQYLQGAEH